MFAKCAVALRMSGMGAIVHFAIDAVTTLFFVGLIGSALVVLLSFVEDMTELLGE